MISRLLYFIVICTVQQGTASIYHNAAILTSSQRHLSGSLTDTLSNLKAKVDYCWGEEIYDKETGNKMPMVTCDFDVPKDYNSTAEIRPGDCENFREFASGPLTQSGKVRATLYQEVTAEERRSVKFVKNFCARSDVFFDVNGSGNQTSVSMTKVNVIITFTVESQSQYLLNVKTTSVEPDKQTRAWFSVLGSLIGVFVVTIMVVLFMKKRGEYHGKRNEQMGKMAGVNISEIMIHEAAFV